MKQTTFQKIARTLCGSLNVSVQFNQSGKISCTPQMINLPSIDHIDDINLMLGYLIHEISHIRHTEWDDWNCVHDSSLHKSLHNLLEDIRVETAINQEFAGAEALLAYAWSVLVSKKSPPTDCYDAVFDHILYRGFQLRNRIGIASNQQILQASLLVSSKWAQLDGDIDASIRSAMAAGSTFETREISSNLAALILDEQPSQPADEDNASSHDEVESEDDASQTDGAESNDAECMVEKAENNDLPADEDGKTSNEVTSCENDVSKNGESEPNDHSTDEDDVCQPGETESEDDDYSECEEEPNSLPTGKDDDSHNGDPESNNAEGKSSTQQPTDETDLDMPWIDSSSLMAAADLATVDLSSELEHPITELIEKSINENGFAQPLLPLAGRRDLEGETSKPCPAILKQLKQLSGKSTSRRPSRRGMVNPRKLGYAGTRVDLFERKQIRQKTGKASITIALDLSLSMTLSRFDSIAISAAQDLAASIHAAPGKDVRVTGFPGNLWHVEQLVPRGAKVPELNGVIADGEYTPIEFALEEAILELNCCRAEKILMVITDGEMAPEQELACKKLVKNNPDIHLLWIGIGVDISSEIGGTKTVIKDIHDLPSCMAEFVINLR
jgi:cobaltochelatase CobT